MNALKLISVVKFGRNGVSPPVCGVPPPEIAVRPPKVVAQPPGLCEILQLTAKWLRFDGSHCIFGQLILEKNHYNCCQQRSDFKA